MTDIVLHSMAEYPHVLRRIRQFGERRSPRGLGTLDLGFTSIVLLNPMAGGMPLGIGRKLNPAIGAVEAIQLISGISDPELVIKLAPQFERYSDTAENGTGDRMFWGAYGDRIKLQAYRAIKKITSDRDTRQAIITLWDPWLDNVEGKHDYPCTIALQFHMRDGLLDMNVIMRSNDAWLGFPYDVFQFTQLQLSMASSLGTYPGLYRHTTLSFHVYEQDEEKINEFITHIDKESSSVTRKMFRDAWQPNGIGHVGQSFTDIMERAKNIIENAPIVDETPSERWYRDQLHPSNVG